MYDYSLSRFTGTGIDCLRARAPPCLVNYVLDMICLSYVCVYVYIYIYIYMYMLFNYIFIHLYITESIRVCINT